MKAIIYACLLACISLPISSSGQERGCEKFKSTADRAKCLDGKLEAAEAAMNKALEAALADYSPRRQREDLSATPKIKQIIEEEDRQTVVALKDSQTHWLSYRDSACTAVEHMYEGGTVASEAVPSCRLELTEQRTNWIEANFGKAKQKQDSISDK